MGHSEFLHFDITEKIIGAVHRVYGKLGTGFPREFYQTALTHELTQKKSSVARNRPVVMRYNDAVIGEWLADLVVDATVIVVVTADESLDSRGETVLLKVLKASEFEVAVAVNFGQKLEVRRKVHSNSNKVG